MSHPTESTTTWRIARAPHPADLDSPDAWAYHGVAEIEAEVMIEAHGYDDLANEARDILAGMDNQQYATKQRFVAIRADAPETPRPQDVLGHLFVLMMTSSNEHLGELYVQVRPAARHQGLGTELWETGEKILVDAGRTVLFTDTQHGVEPPPGPHALEARTGAGRVPADDPGPRFARSKGYALEQVERHSILPLPVEPALLDRLRARARAAAGPDYRPLVWEDDVPHEWREQVGTLFTRMSTDAPNGDIDYREDPWDAQRVGVWIDELLGKGDGLLMTVAEHVPSGTLAAFSVFAYPKDHPSFAFQEDTLVLREHRGHRLGMLVKVRNLDELAARRPTTERIHTWNAEENDHMLAINVDVGFAPAGAYAGWQKRVGA
ncbi:N-acetyltransferase [Oerskovia rustica]|uniref:GNAT family N-acetyltransferase n=1 Tax=Oerskovia rustica TaxID=2762237 RepID=A0ABR8RV61_9CELL|nr:GNAT family N-acetyltransferase [Oerskovia rustica]MBD7951522.1 GNAT family N-acetyltransferase [Oerskovia rustica]